MDLMNILKDYVQVEEIQMPMRDERSNKGFCLVTLKTAEEVPFLSMKLQDKMLFGREIKLKQKHF